MQSCLDTRISWNEFLSENVIGVSEPLCGKHIEARSPYDPPGPPSQPEITAYSPSSASLAWKPPTDTGGRPITGEKNKSSGDSSFEWKLPHFHCIQDIMKTDWVSLLVESHTGGCTNNRLLTSLPGVALSFTSHTHLQVWVYKYS